MSLTIAQRTKLRQFLTTMRRDWHDAGTDEALTQLATHIADPWTITRIAIDWASRPDARLPKGMTNPKLRTTPTGPARNIGHCPDHGGTTRRGPDGPWTCCWLETTDLPDDQVEPMTGVPAGSPHEGERSLLEEPEGAL